MDIKVDSRELISSHLFSDPSYLKGVARIVDLFAQLDEINYSKSEAAADKEATIHDWEIVGENLYTALKKYEEEHQKAAQQLTR